MKKLSLGLICLLVLMALGRVIGWSQQPPPEAPPVSVDGKWILYCNDPNGTTSAKYLDLRQEGMMIKGHFKGTYQSGGVEGTINVRHLVVRTKTNDVLVFRGRVDGPVVNGVIQGQSFNGTFHNRGGRGTFQGQRAQ